MARRSRLQLRRRNLEVELHFDRVTTTTLTRIFSLDPSTIWIKEDFSGRAFFPTAADTFEIPDDVLSGTVEGSALQNTASTSNPTVYSTPLSATSGATPKPLFSKKSNSATVKVVQANMRRNATGKVEFDSCHQTFITVSEANANVHYIQSAIQQKWGPEFVLVTSDGLPIEDSSGTQGLSFWKVGSRKIFAVLNPNNNAQKKTSLYISSESDDDLELKPPSRKAHKGSSAAVSNRATLNKLSSDIESIKGDLQSIFKISKNMKIPIGITKLLQETFMCHICMQSPMKPPIIFGRCCKRIIGCQSCVDEWFVAQGRDEPANCPICRSERAYADTSQVKGMDDFLTSISPLMGSLNDDGDNDSNSDE